MKRITTQPFPIRLLVLLALIWANAATAANFDRGLLWKIEADGSKPSYLFGTMHSEDPEIVRLPAPVQQRFDQSNGVTLEVVLDMESMLAMTGAFMLGDGQTLDKILGAELYRRTTAAMVAQGVPEPMVAGMKPWAVAVTLMMPPSKTGMVLDLLLYQQAVAAGKPVDGLETPQEQMAVFDQLSKADQIGLLKDTLDNQHALPQMLDELKQAYLARDLDRLMQISDESMRHSDPGMVKRFNDRLIHSRNRRMAERLKTRLQRGGQFIAVGALHLPGNEGLLNLLDQQGYRVTPVY